MSRIIGLFLLTILFNHAFSQDTLPNFTVVERGNRVIVSWINPYESIIQLNVQRSFDSLLNFRTVYSATSPELPQNGFSENKMPTNQIYYRIFYVLKGGAYFFSPSKRVGANITGRNNSSPTASAKGSSAGIITIKVRDTVFTTIPAERYRAFRDSVLHHTKDTLTTLNDSLVVIFPFVGNGYFRPSQFVFSTRDGISISLPGANSKKYRIKFFEENGSPLFEIRQVKEPSLILDKANFFHAGWFLFELYEDERLKEKNKFYVSKDF